MISGGGLQRILQRMGLRGRRGIYSVAVVLWLMIWQWLQPRATLSQAGRQLVHGAGRSLLCDCRRVREGRISAAAGGYCESIGKLLKLVPQAVTRELVERLSQQLGEPWPGLGGPVYVLDGTTLQLPYSRKLAQAYPPASNGHGQSHWPILNLLVLHEVTSGLALYPCWGAMCDAGAQSEPRLATRALA
jgi:hypothetical protein